MRLEHYWYRKNAISTLLLPLSWAYQGLSQVRRAYYRQLNQRRSRPSVPVVVVGNVTVGGTGKTPLINWLADLLKARGYKPGIVSRGYGGRTKSWPQFVNNDSDPTQVGDEPVLIASHCRCPVVVDPNRSTALYTLLNASDCDVILSDDGLQHYALIRDIEIAVIDGDRRFGNGYCLPAGPLRESPRRLRQVDFVVANGRARDSEISMNLEGEYAVNLMEPAHQRPLNQFSRSRIHAIAGIGNPNRFFEMLKRRGLEIDDHPFPDHFLFTARDLEFQDRVPVLMTEKDAVKIKRFAKPNFWYVPIQAVLEPGFADSLITTLRRTRHG
jgi:tetraacyldisaccharide 4'-kinase